MQARARPWSVLNALVRTLSGVVRLPVQLVAVIARGLRDLARSFRFWVLVILALIILLIIYGSSGECVFFSLKGEFAAVQVVV
jgi:hypothetical protein